MDPHSSVVVTERSEGLGTSQGRRFSSFNFDVHILNEFRVLYHTQDVVAQRGSGVKAYRRTDVSCDL